MQSIKVSVIIPCYNLGRYIEEALESVLSQTYQDLEIIIVNDGSTDEYTNNLLLNYNRPKTKIITTGNQGASGARNNGIKEARGEYILPLDADDKIEPTFLEKTVRVLDNNPRIHFVYSFAKMFGEVKGTWKMDQFDIKALLVENCVCGCALFRKEAWEKVNGYNPDLRGYEDWDFWLRLTERGYKGHRIPEELFFYRQRHDSKRKTSNLPENHIKSIKQFCLNHKALYQRYIDYVVMQKEKIILDKKKIISDKENIIRDLEYRLQRIRETIIYKTYEKIKGLFRLFRHLR